MNKDDFSRLARVEQEMIDQGEPYRLSHLSEFPFKSLDEVKNAFNKKSIVFGGDYNGDFIRVIGTKSDYALHMFWLMLPAVIAVIDLALAIILGKWVLLWGILLVIIGYLATSPGNPLKSLVSGLGGLTLVSTSIGSIFYSLDWTWPVLVGSLWLSQIFVLTAKNQYQMILEDRALRSEVFLVFFLKNEYLLVKDVDTGKLYTAE